MTFSGALTLTDLNDFITPSQACIKPVEGKHLDHVEPGSASTQIHIDASGDYYETRATDAIPIAQKLEPAQINLNDCLACSGCITSAESVLITLQSHIEVLSVVESNPPPASSEHKVLVLSIAPQALASLAASYTINSSSNASSKDILSRVREFAAEVLGFEYVFDTTFARRLVLLQHTDEYKKRLASRKDEGKLDQLQLPMLASACPGWICYAEKTHSEILPFISRIKSPQQMMGTLVKNWLSRRLEKTPRDMYHVTVMPCYDKKLEASRDDFYDDIYSTRDVDCVITTGELQLLMHEKGFDLSKSAKQILPGQYGYDMFPELLEEPGSSSGSYLQSLVTHVAGKWGEVDVTLETNIIRPDYEETLLKKRDTGEVLFKGARCYGFRNLQNVVRKIGCEQGLTTTKSRSITRGVRKGQSESSAQRLDYIEIMACPSGCVNGGGQLRRPESFTTGLSATDGLDAVASRWGDKAWVSRVEQVYWEHNESSWPDGRLDSLIHEITSDLRGRDTRSMTETTDPFRTTYRKVESEVLGLAVKW